MVSKTDDIFYSPKVEMSSSDSKMGYVDINYKESTDTNIIDNWDYDEGALCLTEDVDMKALRIVSNKLVR